jgi:hypothetical protein
MGAGANCGRFDGAVQVGWRGQESGMTLKDSGVGNLCAATANPGGAGEEDEN